MFYSVDLVDFISFHQMLGVGGVFLWKGLIKFVQTTRNTVHQFVMGKC